MDLPSDPGARHLAEQEARRSQLLLVTSAFRPLLSQRVPKALQEERQEDVLLLLPLYGWTHSSSVLSSASQERPLVR